jgi:hypothetical protein
MRFTMKELFYLLLLVTPVASCTHRNNGPEYISIAPGIHTLKGKPRSCPEKEQSPLVFTSPTMPIGTCKRDSDTTFTCHLVNRGNAPVTIERITGSCGCRAFDYRQKELLPGEKSYIRVKFSAGSSKGFHKKEIYICLKSGKIITLTIFVNVAG